ncbi:MAG TPA: hypothetical protein DCM05_13140 [Elusimicrobia bacterium]|nr:hypothetical protein [Elusimicrobiota bacterium]
MKASTITLLWALPLLSLSALSHAGESLTPLDVWALETRLAEHVQKNILDPVLGAGRASAFAKAKLEFRCEERESLKSGKGHASKEKRRLDPVAVSTDQAPQSEDLLEGLFSDERTKSNNIQTSTTPYQKQNASIAGQRAEQSKSEAESYSSVELNIVKLKLVIVYDDKLPAARLDSAKKVLLAVYKDALKPEDMVWVPAVYAGTPRKAAP